jgi:hypothetical protein
MEGTVKPNGLAANCVKYSRSARLQNVGIPGFVETTFRPRSAQIMLSASTLKVPRRAFGDTRRYLREAGEDVGG